jgi:cytoskeletal protein CcmA (bactofilin family)
MSLPSISELDINIIAEGTRVEGKISFDQITRVHGVLIGEVKSKKGSTLILSETSLVEGKITADILVIDGYVRGDIVAESRVVLSRTGRVIGNIHSPCLVLEFGAYFEGNCSTQAQTKSKASSDRTTGL